MGDDEPRDTESIGLEMTGPCDERFMGAKEPFRSNCQSGNRLGGKRHSFLGHACYGRCVRA